MPGQIETYYPIDYLQRIDLKCYDQIWDELLKDREVEAISRVIQATHLDLAGAVLTVRAVKVDLDKRFPDPIPPETRVLAALDDINTAIWRIQSYTGMDRDLAGKFAEKIKSRQAIRITREQVEELLKFDADGQPMAAVNRLRLYAPGLGLKQAYWFMYDLRKHFRDAISGEKPAAMKQLIPRIGDRYPVSMIRRELEGSVETRLRQDFDRKKWNGIRLVLNLYGEEDHEMEIERVRLSIVKQANGDEMKLLQLMSIAKIDYREVLREDTGTAV